VGVPTKSKLVPEFIQYDTNDKDEHTKPKFRLRQTLSGDADDNIHHLNQNLKLY
jgi:hypothetical protein